MGEIGYRAWQLYSIRLREKMMLIARLDIMDAVAAFCEAWNEGDLERACKIYAEDAVRVSSKGRGCFRGKGLIVAEYKREFPDVAAMGSLEMKIVDFKSAGVDCNMAGALLLWEIRDPDGTLLNRCHVLLTCMMDGEKVHIRQEVSVPLSHQYA